MTPGPATGGLGSDPFSSLDGVITKSAQLHWTDLTDDPWPCHGPSDNKKGTQTPLKASFQMILSSFFVGDPLGVRTRDPILKRDVLYLLS